MKRRIAKVVGWLLNRCLGPQFYAGEFLGHWWLGDRPEYFSMQENIAVYPERHERHRRKLAWQIVKGWTER